jgi:hypothetical protein
MICKVFGAPVPKSTLYRWRSACGIDGKPVYSCADVLTVVTYGASVKRTRSAPLAEVEVAEFVKSTLHATDWDLSWASEETPSQSFLESLERQVEGAPLSSHPVLKLDVCLHQVGV